MKTKKVLSVLLYKIILELSYIYVVSPIFYYSGLIYDPSISKLIISYILTIVVIIILPESNKVSDYLLNFMFIVTIVPLISVFWMMNQSFSYVLMFLSVFVLMIYITNVLPSSLNITYIKSEMNIFSKSMLIVTIFIFSIGLLLYRLLFIEGINFDVLNFEEVYELRESIEISGISLYLYSWLGKVFIPFLIVYSFYKRKKVLLLCSILLQFSLYLSSGNKTILFSIVLIMISYILLKYRMWTYGFPLLSSIFIVISVMVYFLSGNIWFIALFIVRFLFLPSVISFKYFNFFEINPKLHFSEGILGEIFNINSPYNSSIGFIISQKINVNENTGFFGDAFSNGGYIAMLILGIILSLILWLLNILANNDKQVMNFVILMMVYPIIILNDGSLLTLLFTGGLIINIFLIYLFVSKEQIEKIRIENSNE